MNNSERKNDTSASFKDRLAVAVVLLMFSLVAINVIILMGLKLTWIVIPNMLMVVSIFMIYTAFKEIN